MQIIFQLDMPNKVPSLTLAFMKYNSLMVGLRNTLLMTSLKTCSKLPMPMNGTLVFLKKYKSFRSDESIAVPRNQGFTETL